MLERFESRAKDLSEYDEFLKTYLNSISGPGVISMMYSILAKGTCKDVHDKDCFTHVDKNSSWIIVGFILFYPIVVSLLNPSLYKIIKSCFDHDDYKFYNEIISEGSNIVFKSSFYFMFLMYFLDVTGHHNISYGKVILSGLGCFLFAFLSNKEFQYKLNSCLRHSECCDGPGGRRLKNALIGIKDFIFDALDGFSVAHGIISSIQSSLSVIAELPSNRVVRLGLSGGGAILFATKNAIWPAVENNGEDENSRVSKIANLILSASMLFLFYMEFITGIMATEDRDFMKILYPLLAISSLVVLAYSLGRQCFSEEKRCCLERQEYLDGPPAQSDNEETPLSMHGTLVQPANISDMDYSGSTTTIGAGIGLDSVSQEQNQERVGEISYLYGDNYSPGFFSPDPDGEAPPSVNQNQNEHPPEHPSVEQKRISSSSSSS